MAETKEAYDFPTRYPWNQWANGEIWTLTRGVDFKVSVKSFRGAAWLHARDAKPPMNLRTSVHIEYQVDEDGEFVLDEDGKKIPDVEQVTVQFSPKSYEELSAQLRK